LLDANDENEEDITPDCVEIFSSSKSGSASQDDSDDSQFAVTVQGQVSVQKLREEPETCGGKNDIR
jgi:hypothetical protein